MVWYVIDVYKMNRTLHDRLEIRNIFSCVEEFVTREIFFQHSRRNFVFPRGHVISSICYSFKIVAPIPRLIPHNPLALTIFGRRRQ